MVGKYSRREVNGESRAIQGTETCGPMAGRE